MNVAPKTTVWTKIPAHEELRVVDARVLRADRAAEDEGEQQHEHDRREQREDQQVRDPQDLAQVPLRDGDAVGHGLGEAHRLLLGGLFLGCVPGQLHEDVVEGGAAQADFVHLDAHCRRGGAAARRGRRTRRRPARSGDGRAGPRGSRRSRAPARPTRAGSRSPGLGERDLDAAPRPPATSSSSEVPRAMTLPWSITAIRSASRSASSRYCVVSRGSCRPRRDRRSCPTSRPGRGGRGRSSARRGRARAAAQRGRRRGRADGASRRTSP